MQFAATQWFILSGFEEEECEGPNDGFQCHYKNVRMWPMHFLGHVLIENVIAVVLCYRNNHDDDDRR